MIKLRRYFLPCLESLGWLTWFKLLIVFVPYPWWRSGWGVVHAETLRAPMIAHRETLATVRRVVTFGGKWVPWKSKCLDQALAAQRMLARRGLGTTLYLGMVREGEDWMAHAWVRCGTEWVVGYHPHIQYGVVGTYAKV